MLDKSPLFQLGLLLCILQLLIATAWLWQLWAVNNDQDELRRQLFRDHSATLAAALEPALAHADQTAIAAILDHQIALPELEHLGVYDPSEQLLTSIGAPLPLQSSAQSSHRERMSGDFFVVEQAITASTDTLATLQTSYRFKPYTLFMLLSDSWSAATMTLLSLVVFLWLLAQRLRPFNQHVALLEQQLIKQRSKSIPETLESGGGLQGICDQINIIQRAWYQQLNSANKRVAHHRAERECLQKLIQGLGGVLWRSQPPSDRLLDISQNAALLFDYSHEYWLADGFLRDHIHPTDYALVREFLQHPSPNDEPDTFEIRLRDKHNEWRWLRFVLLVQGQGNDLSISGALLDISEAKQNEQRAIQLSNTDPLTGLYNRQYFLRYLQDQIADQQRNNQTGGAVLFLDLDRFEFVNAMFGQSVGDTYLCRFAKHLGELFKDSGVLGRVGGDEFAVILPGYDGEKASRIVQQLLEVLRKIGFSQDNNSIPFSASIGIALYPNHAAEPDQLLTLAAATMYQAKKRGRGTYQMAAASETETDSADLGVIWDDRLRKALEKENLTLFFQPIIDLDIGMIHHYECLLRLFDEIGRSIDAQIFMAPAERLGLRDKLERWGLVNALRTQGVNARIGQRISITLNLSSRQVNHSDLVDVILATSEENGVTPEDIVFEISVETVTNNIDRVRELINTLGEHKYRFALDNFGIGTLSFDDLRSLKIEYLKIDSDLVSKIVWSPADRAMVQAITDLAQGLDLKLIAMGVESDQVLKVLRDLDIGFGQGRFFAEPAPRFHEHERIILTDYSEDEWG